MRLLRTTAAVLLLASLLSNALLLARGGGRSHSNRTSAPGPQEPGRASVQLLTLRGRNEILKEKIRRLESSPASALPADPAVSGEAAAPSFRERIRRYFKLIASEAPFEDPESALEISEAYLEFQRAAVDRTKNPAAYDQCLRELFDTLLHDEQLKLTADQSSQFRGILEEYRQGILKVRADSIPEENLADLEIEASAMNRARALLNEEQYGHTTQLLGGLGFFVEAMWYWGVSTPGAEQTLASAWTQAYQLDETQQAAVEEAARSFAETLRQIELEHRRSQGAPRGRAKGYEVRIRAQQAQIASLKRLENVMTPEQKERFRSKQLIDFNLQIPLESGK